MKFKRNNPGEVFSWSMYDFANSAFATSILAVIFNQYFAMEVAGGYEGTLWNLFGREIRVPGASLFQYSVSISMLLVVLSAPILGAVADYIRGKKKFLVVFCATGAAATGLLYFIRSGDYIGGAVLFIIANYAFAGGNVFYNALLIDIAHPDDMGKISGWGWGIGYLGGGLCLLLNLVMLQNPGWFGFDEIKVYSTFPVVAGWWLIFSIPLFLWVKESSVISSAPVKKDIFKTGFTRFRKTLKEIKRYRQLVKFLFAYLMFNEGIETVIISASIFGAAEIGMDTPQLIIFFLVVQGSAFLGSLIFGYIVDLIGNRRALLITIVIWSGIVLWARFIGLSGNPVGEFYVLGVLAGSVMGGSQSAARSLQGLFTPIDKGAEFFGFFAVCGKFAAMFGPAVYGTAVVITGNMRSGILVLLGFFILGGLLLYFVDEEEGIAAAKN